MMIPRPGSPPLREVPVANLSLRRWRHVAMAMLVAGAALIEFGLLTQLIESERPWLVQSAAGVFVLLAIGTALVTPQTYRPFTRLVVAVTILEITLLSQAFEGIVTIPVYYVWPLLGASYLLTRGDVVVFTAMCIVGYALGGSKPPELGLADYASITVVGVMVLVTVRVLAENLGMSIRSLRRASLTDPLTGLLNRRAIAHHAGEAITKAQATSEPLAVLVFDIDHFKRINDRFGHAAGDAALVRFSQILVGACDGADRVARIGGEEFAVLMPGASASDALERATAFTDRLRADRSIEGLRLTASGGIATLSGSAAATWDELLRAADDAAYEAKRGGRDRIVLASLVRRQPGRSAAFAAPRLDINPLGT